MSCSILIEGVLEDIGVDAKCNYVKNTVEAVWDPGKIKEKEIVEEILKSGYKVISYE